MANYMGMKFNQASDAYGTDALSGNTLPDFFAQTNSHEAGLNIEEPDVTAMDTDLPRGGYPEPEGKINTSAHTKALPTYFYSLLGNYRFTEDGATLTIDGESVTQNVHEFWMGENSELPQWSGLFTYGDFMQKKISGAVTDTMDWNATLDKTELELGFKYRNELSKQVNIETARQDYEIISGLPLIGYDYRSTLTIVEDNTITSNCFREAKISVNNNLITGEDIRCLGQRKYSIQPSSENKEIDIELTTKFDRRNYELITAAAYGNTNVANGYHGLEDCKNFTGRFTLYASACTEGAERVSMAFPRNIITVDTISADGNNLEATLNLKPVNTGKVTLLDGTTQINTPMYVKIISSADVVE